MPLDRRTLIRIVLVASLAGGTARDPACAAPAEPGNDAREFGAKVRPFLVKHCLECHRGDNAEKELRLDRIDADFADGDNRQRWRNVLTRIKSGEMPPKKKPRPQAADVESVSGWIAERIHRADSAKRAAEGRVVLRRLNRGEYERTVCDLLGVKAELQELLPQDSSAAGFDNVGDALHVSSFLLERYLEAADVALNQAIANRPRPPSTKKRYSLQETHQLRSSEERVYRKADDGSVVLFSSSPWNAVVLSPFYPPDRGKYRFRISSSAVQSAGKPVTYRLDAGTMSMTGRNHLVGYFDASPTGPGVMEFVEHLEARSTIRVLPYALAGAQVVHKLGADSYDGPGVLVDWIEVEGPINETWPPESHRRIFGEMEQAKAPSNQYSDRVEVVSSNPREDAGRILRNFVRRAYRRAATSEDVGPFLGLVESRLAEGHSFEQAIRVGLAAVMTSPEFLFLYEKPGRLDDFAVASRLSYFLWSTLPDEELLALAEAGARRAASNRSDDGTRSVPATLSDPDVLRSQVERMLQAPQAAAFVENFVGQWLGLRDIDFTIPNHILYPEFDEMLKASMVRETELFFQQVLADDLSIANFVDSDFSMLNGRLAKHYGIPGVHGWEFRKTSLPREAHRGGVMTMASVLKVTANGTDTSPVTRGAWVLDRILGTPPPKPPENIAALEPDIRGATTIREQLAKHRQIESCAACHAKIDPPGFALESFDVIGGWRDHYRLLSWRRGAEEVILNGRKMNYYRGLAVDPADVLPDGRAFRNIDELKSLLLSDKDDLARALAMRLLTYATGGPPEPSDQPQIDAIVARAREKNYGLRSLIHAIVASDLFRMK
ncbi:MAG: DUF1592 domain-containing protein [Planctomycetia bacterium]|nr:DUF1592 domain-containing protein [Planctomycetia bacterium]